MTSDPGMGSGLDCTNVSIEIVRLLGAAAAMASYFQYDKTANAIELAMQVHQHVLESLSKEEKSAA